MPEKWAEKNWEGGTRRAARTVCCRSYKPGAARQRALKLCSARRPAARGGLLRLSNRHQAATCGCPTAIQQPSFPAAQLLPLPSTARNASTTVRHSMMRAPLSRPEACTLAAAGTTKVRKPSCGGAGWGGETGWVDSYPQTAQLASQSEQLGKRAAGTTQVWGQPSCSRGQRSQADVGNLSCPVRGRPQNPSTARAGDAPCPPSVRC